MRVVAGRRLLRRGGLDEAELGLGELGDELRLASRVELGQLLALVDHAVDVLRLDLDLDLEPVELDLVADGQRVHDGVEAPPVRRLGEQRALLRGERDVEALDDAVGELLRDVRVAEVAVDLEVGLADRVRARDAVEDGDGAVGRHGLRRRRAPHRLRREADLLLVLRELLVRRLAGPERLLDGAAVHVLADDDELRAPVAVGLLPERRERVRHLRRRRAAARLARAALVVDGRRPGVAELHGEAAAREAALALLPVALLVREPDEALGADDAALGRGRLVVAVEAVEAVARPRVDRRHEAPRLEGPPAAEREGRDAVLDALRDVLADARLLEPARVLLGLGQVEEPGPQQLARVHGAVGRLDELRARVHAPEERAELRLSRVVHEVHLVHDDDVRELDLVAEELRDGALVARARLPAAALERVGRVELLHEARAVDDGHERVEARDLRQRRAAAVLERERLRDGHGLGDAAALDEDVVEALGPRRELGELDEEVLAERAADAAVLERDHLLLGVDERALVDDEVRVDVDLGHVVDDDRDPEARAVLEHVLEQRRLARAEEARKHRHGQRPRPLDGHGRGGAAHDVHGVARRLAHGLLQLAEDLGARGRRARRERRVGLLGGVAVAVAVVRGAGLAAVRVRVRVVLRAVFVGAGRRLRVHLELCSLGRLDRAQRLLLGHRGVHGLEHVGGRAAEGRHALLAREFCSRRLAKRSQYALWLRFCNELMTLPKL